MKRIDDSTLEAIAEMICGAGEGAGGGYSAPGPYRTKTQICDFFRRAGVNPQGMSSTRKWFALESLQAVNGTLHLDSVLKRLASPKEYRGDATVTQTVTDHMNHILQTEGLELVLVGVEPQIRERKAAASVPKPKDTPIESPLDFGRLVQDPSLAEILTFRWAEAQRCSRADAHLSAVVMMGSILEGVLLHKVEHNMRVANQAKTAPKDKTGAVYIAGNVILDDALAYVFRYAVIYRAGNIDDAVVFQAFFLLCILFFFHGNSPKIGY